MNAALIIMVRNPQLGKVKSRLAASVGPDEALKIYKWLLAHTLAVTKDLEADKFIFYDQFIDPEDLWPNSIYKKMMQQGEGLGVRMKNAFNVVFGLGYDQVILIGSDCFEISSEDITLGFESLKTFDFTIGPAIDGGYYLLGMRFYCPAIFEEKKWSTESVMEDTLIQVRTLGHSCQILRELRDVDEVGDLPLRSVIAWGLKKIS